MRISSQQIYDSGLQSMQTHMADVAEYQRQISSGQRFSKASENPMAAGLGVQIGLKSAEFSMYKVNQDHIYASLTSTDSQLTSMQRMLANFQQMMVQAANDSLGTENRKLLAQQADVLYQSAAKFASAKDANGLPILKDFDIKSVLVAPSLELDTGVSHHLPMGRQADGSLVLTMTQPLGGVASAGQIVYFRNVASDPWQPLLAGTTPVSVIQVAGDMVSLSGATNTTNVEQGTEILFLNAGTAAGAQAASTRLADPVPVDVLQTMQDVKAALAVGTAPSAAQLEQINTALQQVTRAQVKTGVLQNQLEASTEAAALQQSNVDEQRATLLDTNLADATAGLARSNALLQAVQSIISRMDTNSLFKKL